MNPAAALLDRLGNLERFVAVTRGRVPDGRLGSATAVLDRAAERLDVSLGHTVVALAGATGSGKSSLFNAVTGLELAEVGVRRPTTARPYACVWGPEGAAALLDWLQVPLWHARESALDAEDEAALRGMVLVDLPDFDSTERAHREEVDRLLARVDLMVWVLDPQKYADRLVHRSYLSQFGQYREVTVVVLNKVDALPAAGVAPCLADLTQLLAQDGLSGVPVLATSATTGSGIAELRSLLVRAVASRRAALARLAADVDNTVIGLRDLVGPAVGELDEDAVSRTGGALAATAGVDVVAAAAGHSYRRQGVAATGWPPTRWLARIRGDPLARLHLEPSAAMVPRTSVPPPSAARRAAATLAVRELAATTSWGLPAPWPEVLLAAARSREEDLDDALDRAVGSAEITPARPRWWQVVGVAQWVLALCALAGAAWLLAGLGLAALGVDLALPKQGALPVPTLVLGCGLLGGLLLGILVRPLLQLGAQRATARAHRRLRQGVDAVTEEYVAGPVRAELATYAEARSLLQSL